MGWFQLKWINYWTLWLKLKRSGKMWWTHFQELHFGGHVFGHVVGRGGLDVYNVRHKTPPIILEIMWYAFFVGILIWSFSLKEPPARLHPSTWERTYCGMEWCRSAAESKSILELQFYKTFFRVTSIMTKYLRITKLHGSLAAAQQGPRAAYQHHQDPHR